MDWTERTAAVKAGEAVAYSKRFLRSTGQLTGDAPLARGTVTGLTALCGIVLADVARDGVFDLPTRANVKNLSRVKDGVVMDLD